MESSDGTVDFKLARFSGSTVDFGAVQFFFDGTIGFRAVEFSSGTVDFAHATGTAPLHLVPPSESALPTGLLLPSAWSA
ncbi:hypothetical protein [Streptomyces sp. NPDC056821]|uniref:hypothetical protein n=1 Tax=unclassified Streptomyces TaxID=2593676 RepID=UPI003682CAD2